MNMLKCQERKGEKVGKRCQYETKVVRSTPFWGVGCVEDKIECIKKFYHGKVDVKEVASRFNEKEIRDKVLLAMTDRNYSIRSDAGNVIAFALKNEDTRKNALEFLKAGLKHPDVAYLVSWAKSTVRENSAAILKDAKCNIGDAVNDLIEALSDPCSGVRSMSKYALVNAGINPETEEFVKRRLDEVLDGHDFEKIKNAAYVLNEIGASEEKILHKFALMMHNGNAKIVLNECHDSLVKGLEDPKTISLEIAKGYEAASKELNIRNAVPHLVKALLKKNLSEHAFNALKNQLEREPRDFGLIENAVRSKDMQVILEHMPKRREVLKSQLAQLKA